MVDFIQVLTTLGLQVQTGHYEWFSNNSFATTALAVYLPLSIIGIVIAFGAYKEYKALFFEQAGAAPAGGGGGGMGFPAPGGGQEGAGGIGADPRAGQYNAGAGYRAYQPPNYDRQNQNEPQQQQRSGGHSGGSGGFQAFSGQGVRLGGS